MNNRNCSGCKYWDGASVATRAECRATLPVFNEESDRAWPITYSDDWCAYWVRRTPGRDIPTGPKPF